MYHSRQRNGQSSPRRAHRRATPVRRLDGTPAAATPERGGERATLAPLAPAGGSGTTVLGRDADELRGICALPTEAALPEAAAFLTDLVRDPIFAWAQIPSILEEARGAKDWYVARRYEAEDGSYSLQVFVWPAGTGTRIHDHSSWGAYHCAAGSVLEERYERLDDGSTPGHAHLRESWRLAWDPQDGASTVLPGNGGIHRVSNPGSEVAVSVHLYGPRTEKVDGRDYDPTRDYVCDRMEDEH